METSTGMMQRIRRFSRVTWLVLEYAFDRLVRALVRDVRVMWRESELFFGLALFLIGILGFESGKYCDGNTADYLSCTRPATYYYFDALHIALIILGVFLVLLWFLKYREENV